MNPIEAQLFGSNNGTSVSDQLFPTVAEADVSSQLFGNPTPSVHDQLFDDNNGIEEDEEDEMDEDEMPEPDDEDDSEVAGSDVYGQLFEAPQGSPTMTQVASEPTASVSQQLFGGKEYTEGELLSVPGLDLTRLLSPFPSQTPNLTVNIGVVNIFNDGQ